VADARRARVRERLLDHRLGPPPDRLAAPGELLRVQRFATVPAAAANAVVQNLEEIPPAFVSLATTEIERPLYVRSPDYLRLSPDRIARDVADDTAKLPAVFGLDRRPLGEIDDREHRTDPHDDRPEATLWQRIARRLRL